MLHFSKQKVKREQLLITIVLYYFWPPCFSPVYIILVFE